MEQFIEKPNLPQGRVSSVIIGKEYRHIAEAIKRLDIRVIELPVNHDVPVPVRSHADMSAYYCGSGEIILSKSIFPGCCAEAFPDGAALRQAVYIQSPKYPHDISLNACDIGGFVICSREFTDPMILEYADMNGKTIINSKQGYAKCSVCVLDETHIITADRSIYVAAENAGIEALLIEPGFFGLAGYEYGFIGGSCFKISSDTIAFTGSLSGHPYENKILDYIEKIGLNTMFITNGPCIDIGSVIPLTEER